MPPEVLKIKNSRRLSSPGFHPMPTSWVHPNKSPLGASRRSSGVNGSDPTGPFAEVSTSNNAGSESRIVPTSLLFINNLASGGLLALGEEIECPLLAILVAAIGIKQIGRQSR